MKWYIGLILGLSMVLCASVSQADWKMRILHKGGTIEERFLADIDSLTFYDVQAPAGMVLVPSGTFIMGSPTSEPGRNSDETQHAVTLTKAIYVSAHEVTQSEWQAVMGWNEASFAGAIRPLRRVREPGRVEDADPQGRGRRGARSGRR
jgi:formylglycine-generating enzyme required for sulfatase activity